jgi:mono/diheme cytochrome c family protein
MPLVTTRRLAGVVILASVGLAATGIQAQQQPSGRDLYLHACADCHQANGAGEPGEYPPLVHDPLVTGAPTLGARIVLEGAGPMPNFDQQLTDAQIAAVLTYVRSSFGNNAGPVSPAVVAGVRNALAHGH